MRNEGDESMKETLHLSVRVNFTNAYSRHFENLESARRRVLQARKWRCFGKISGKYQFAGRRLFGLHAPEKLLEKMSKVKLLSSGTGFVTEIDTKTIGYAVGEIGGGRTKVDDMIDFGVGFECLKKIGDQVNEGEELGMIYCRNESQASHITQKIQDAYTISEHNLKKNVLIHKIIS